MCIIFFDTETTGNTSADHLCQLGIKERGIETPIINALYKPPVPITFEAMAVHHITETMVVGKPSFRESPEYVSLKQLFEDDATIAVAHNVKFDVMMLRNEGIDPKRTICTLKLARDLDTQGMFSNYQLQYLRYRLDLNIENVTAHDAWSDVLVLEKLFERLLAKYVATAGDEVSALRVMQEVSTRPSLIRTISFGKHAGKKVEDLAREDRSYLQWLLDEKRKNAGEEEDWIYTLENALAQ